MKHFATAVLAVIIVLASGIRATAQDYIAPDVTISKEKVRIDGKVFYSHVVLERQTLYSIAKAYGVGMDELYAANASLKENGLKKNSILLIPIHEETRQIKTRDEKQVQKETEKAEKREARKKTRKEKEEYIIHTVKWYEDLDVIAEKYGVEVEAIMAANNLKGRKLSNRQKLRIPTGRTVVPMTPVEPAQRQDQDSGEAEKTDKTVEETPVAISPEGLKEIRAVIMLPANASSERQSESAMDFYSGALLAVRDNAAKGIDIDLSTYDTGKGMKAVTDTRLALSDFVIGPFLAGDLDSLAARMPEKTMLVSPLDHRAEVTARKYSNFVQAPASTREQYADLVRWVREDMTPADTVVMIYEKNFKGTEEAAEFAALLDSSDVRFNSFAYSILEGRDILDTLSTKMTATGMNRVLIASESEAFVNDVIRNLNLTIHNKYRVTLYCPSKIRSFETADTENLHNVNLHVSTAYFIDYDDAAVQAFLMKYRALFNAEPSAFAYQGYDVMNGCIQMFARYGREWKSSLASGRMRMLQSDLEFRQCPDGGFINTAIRRIVYNPDFSITEIR